MRAKKILVTAIALLVGAALLASTAAASPPTTILKATDYGRRAHWLSLPTGAPKRVAVFYLYPTEYVAQAGDPIIGPVNDPAGIRGIKSASAAFSKIASSGSGFVSRGDNSGTNTKELDLWKKAGIDPRGKAWYMEVGQGMEKTQRIANEKKAYTLTDRGTWLATKDKDRLEMSIVLEGDKILFNQYGVMAVNPQKHKHVKYADAMKFVNWMISKDGQQAIVAFKDKNGNPLFIPNAN